MSSDPQFSELLSRRPQLNYSDKNGLEFDGVNLTEIAQHLGTPCWVLSADTFTRRLHALKSAIKQISVDVDIHYALKANDTLSILRVAAQHDIGGDIVSGGELKRAQKAGLAPSRLIYSGVGKQDWELAEALDAGIGQINIESLEEIDDLCEIAQQKKQHVNVVLRINPDIDAGTLNAITTGRADTKFGIPLTLAKQTYRKLFDLPYLTPKGFAVHIGSQITSLAPYKKTFSVMRQLITECREDGLRVSSLDCGGGLGVSYKDEQEMSPEGYMGLLEDIFKGMDLRLCIEPGRWLIAPSGILLSKVILNKKQGLQHPFLIIDAAMNDFIRPGMYDAWHGFLPLSKEAALRKKALCHIAGPVCENTDTFTRNRYFPHLTKGELLAIVDTGAYGEVMSSTYNARPLAPIALIHHEKWDIIKKRQDYAQLWENEFIL